MGAKAIKLPGPDPLDMAMPDVAVRAKSAIRATARAGRPAKQAQSSTPVAWAEKTAKVNPCGESAGPHGPRQPVRQAQPRPCSP